MTFATMNACQELLLGSVFQSERTRFAIAHFRWAPILYRPGIYKAGAALALVAMLHKLFERRALEVYQSLANDWFHFAIATLHVEHHGDGHTACLPFGGRSGEILNSGHIARLAVCDKVCGAYTERIAVVGVKIGWRGTSSLIAKEMVQRGELTAKLALFRPFLKLVANHV